MSQERSSKRRASLAADAYNAQQQEDKQKIQKQYVSPEEERKKAVPRRAQKENQSPGAGKSTCAAIKTTPPHPQGQGRAHSATRGGSSRPTTPVSVRQRSKSATPTKKCVESPGSATKSVQVEASPTKTCDESNISPTLKQKREMTDFEKELVQKLMQLRPKDDILRQNLEREIPHFDLKAVDRFISAYKEKDATNKMVRIVTPLDNDHQWLRVYVAKKHEETGDDYGAYGQLVGYLENFPFNGNYIHGILWKKNERLEQQLRLKLTRKVRRLRHEDDEEFLEGCGSKSMSPSPNLPKLKSSFCPTHLFEFISSFSDDPASQYIRTELLESIPCLEVMGMTGNDFQQHVDTKILEGGGKGSLMALWSRLRSPSILQRKESSTSISKTVTPSSQKQKETLKPFEPQMKIIERPLPSDPCLAAQVRALRQETKRKNDLAAFSLLELDGPHKSMIKDIITNLRDPTSKAAEISNKFMTQLKEPEGKVSDTSPFSKICFNLFRATCWIGVGNLRQARDILSQLETELKSMEDYLKANLEPAVGLRIAILQSAEGKPSESISELTRLAGQGSCDALQWAFKIASTYRDVAKVSQSANGFIASGNYQAAITNIIRIVTAYVMDKNTIPEKKDEDAILKFIYDSGMCTVSDFQLLFKAIPLLQHKVRVLLRDGMYDGLEKAFSSGRLGAVGALNACVFTKRVFTDRQLNHPQFLQKAQSLLATNNDAKTGDVFDPEVVNLIGQFHLLEKNDAETALDLLKAATDRFEHSCCYAKASCEMYALFHSLEIAYKYAGKNFLKPYYFEEEGIQAKCK